MYNFGNVGMKFNKRMDGVSLSSEAAYLSACHSNAGSIRPATAGFTGRPSESFSSESSPGKEWH